MKIEDYNKYYIQGSDQYLIPKDVFKELFNEMVNWKEENKQLKDNWNMLKEHLTNLIPTDKTVLTKYIKIFEVLDRMKELEGSDSNV